MTKYVALKIATAESSATENEMAILEHLSHGGLHHPGKSHVTTLLDSFEHHGPNGVHRCFVFDVMGPNTSTMFEKLPPSLNARFSGQRVESSKSNEQDVSNYVDRERGRYPLWMAKAILRQTLLGIDFLHKSGITHGDLQPGNIMFSVKDLSLLSESQLAQVDEEEYYFTTTVNANGEVQFHPKAVLPNLDSPGADGKESDKPQANFETDGDLDEKASPSAPRHIAMKQPLLEYVGLDPPLLIKISDFGGSFFHFQPPAKPVTPLGLRCPELVLGEPITQAQDIWSFGCLMFEFITARMLFSVTGLPGLTEAKTEEYKRRDDDDHFLQFADVLGDLPSGILSRWPRSHLYVNDRGEVTKHYIGNLPEGYDISSIEPQSSLEAFFDREKPVDLNASEASVVVKLLRYILQYDSAKRPSASEILSHPWFADQAITNN